MRFWDENKQKIRMGSDLQKCYYSRDLLAESLVSGDMTHLVIEATDQYSWLTINGRVTNITEDKDKDNDDMLYERNLSIKKLGFF